MMLEKQKQGTLGTSNEGRKSKCSRVRIGLRVLAAAGAISSGTIMVLDSVRQLRECNNLGDCYEVAGATICD